MKKVLLKMVALLLIVVPVVGVLTACGEKPASDEIEGRYSVVQVVISDSNTTMTINDYNELLAKENPSTQEQANIQRFSGAFSMWIEVNADNTAVFRTIDSTDQCVWSIVDNTFIIREQTAAVDDCLTLRIEDGKLIWQLSTYIITFSK